MRIIEFNFDNWKFSKCNCPWFFKNYKCRNVIILATILFPDVSFPVAAMQIPIGQNRKRGRPCDTTKALEKQTDEQESSSSDESSIDSTSELLRRIDLNAENEEAENDTLVDASSLNETADQDINTENNEALIQMVVPASIAGFAIRGGRGGRGAAVESINEI